MARKDRTRNLWDAVTEKFGREPVLIEKLRVEGADRETYRVHWTTEEPSTVIGVGWVEFTPKWIQEAQYPQKGGNVLEMKTYRNPPPKRNPAVAAAYEAGTYTDVRENVWRRGMDGWFLDDVDGKGGMMLARHDDFVEMVETEHPE